MTSSQRSRLSKPAFANEDGTAWQFSVMPARPHRILEDGRRGATAMAAHAFLSRIGIEHPILLAPMAGSGGTPELAAAVSNAGGLGAWGGAYAKPEEIAAAIRRIRSLTDRPFNINLFAGGYETDSKIDPRPMLDIVGEAHAALGLPPPGLPPVPFNPFDAQLEAVL